MPSRAAVPSPVLCSLTTSLIGLYAVDGDGAYLESRLFPDEGVGCIEHRQRKSTETRKARSATARLIGCSWTWRGPFSKSTHRRVSCLPTLDCTHLPCVVRLLYRPQAEYLAVFFLRSSLSCGASSSTPFVSRPCRSFYIVSLSFAFLQSRAVR